MLAHASMGAIQEVFHWNWDAAQQEYLTALRLNPGYVTARQWYALALAHRGRIEEALAQISVATDADPLSFMLNASVALIHYLGRAYDAAEEHCLRALEINPHHEPAHFTLALAHQQRGRIEAARAELEKALSISRGERTSSPPSARSIHPRRRHDSRRWPRSRSRAMSLLSTSRRSTPHSAIANVLSIGSTARSTRARDGSSISGPSRASTRCAERSVSTNC